MQFCIEQTTYILEFPSPCGERVLLNLHARSPLSAYKGSAVSVPLRGKGSVERATGLSLIGQLDFVSVPLRGKGSVELAEGNFDAESLTSRFPSPCGERVLLNESGRKATAALKDKVSVPLRGKGSVERNGKPLKTTSPI